MNSPPNSILLRRSPGPELPATVSDKSDSDSSGPDLHHVRLPTMSPSDDVDPRDAEADAEAEAKSAARRLGPPSPASSTSAIAVGSTQEAAVIQSIERGEYGAEDLDDTRSLTDSIRQHIVDGGLRYHAYHAGKYLFPNDETEQYRDDLKHNLTVYLCDGESFFAPIHDRLEAGAEVLDLGTGTGKWCIDRKSQSSNRVLRLPG